MLFTAPELTACGLCSRRTVHTVGINAKPGLGAN